MKNSALRAPFTVSLLATAMMLVGCGEPEIAKAEIEQQAQKQLTASVGKEAPPVTCPGNLKAVVGTTMACGMDIDGKTHDVTVKVTAVEGSNASFDITVADKPRG